MNKVGLWDADPLFPGSRAHPTRDYIVEGRLMQVPAPAYVFPQEVWNIRRTIIEDLGSKRSKRFIQHYAGNPNVNDGGTLVSSLSFRFKLDAQVATGIVTTATLWEMLQTTISVDITRGFSFQTCQREDCTLDKYFSVETGHKRKYCSQYCGHLESMRKNRRIEKAMRKGAKR
jgi:hypothetical protein